MELFGTKAETLDRLQGSGFPVPKVYYFSVGNWKIGQSRILDEIMELYSSSYRIVVRSSAIAEDTNTSSMAGAYHSELNVNAKNRDSIKYSIDNVINSFDALPENQVLIQPMIQDVLLAGVMMTKVLDDGSPYYVINYDDSTGKTDTITAGHGVNKTVYIYNGVLEKDFDSPLLLDVLLQTRRLEATYPNTPLDIEFAIDQHRDFHLLQVRRITTEGKWNSEVNKLVSRRIRYLRGFIKNLMTERQNLFGSKSLLGIMPDWNPAEMIGVVPHPLSASLYRELITKRVWSVAREKMGYRAMPSVELMVSLFGRAYIDVRNSFNSFIPSGLNDDIAAKLVTAYISRLEGNPHLHDKIEFEIVLSAYDFEFHDKINGWYPGLFTLEEQVEIKAHIRKITKRAIKLNETNTLVTALNDIEKLRNQQKQYLDLNLDHSFSIADRIKTLISECKNFGTLPFSIIARHGFIAEILLRSLLNSRVITEKRISLFRRSFRTIAGEMSSDYYNVCSGKLSKNTFIGKYGHLRPSSYDILSPRYADRKDLFDGKPQRPKRLATFELSAEERSGINILLTEHGFDGIKPEDLFKYFETAIVGREYAKYIFTYNVSGIIELVASWGKLHGFNRKQLSMLTIADVLEVLYSPLTENMDRHFKRKIKRAEANYQVATSFKLNYLIRSERDVNIVPMQRSSANFIGSKRIEGKVEFLSPYTESTPNLERKIICIEGADPGYDWVFSRNILGLVTKYGGANSHMAIRCAELNLPAAIGCGEQPFDRILNAGACMIDCQREILEPAKLF